MNPFDQDLKFLRTAIRLAGSRSLAGHGGPFGAVIVENGAVVSRGWNRVTSTNDPTAHAEMVAIRRACRKLGKFNLSGCVLYTSCEPCPMCLAAAYWARVDRLVFAAEREDAAAIGFDDALLYREIPLPHQERSLPMTQSLRHEAVEVMQSWSSMPNRILY